MSIKHLQIHRPTKLSSGARLSPFRDQAIWSRHNQKILKTCALVVLPMLAFTIAILSLVFANQIDPYDCPNADLCSTTNTTTARMTGVYYTTVSVGRLAFISSLSATFAGILVAAQMTLFSFVMAARLLDSKTTLDPSQKYPDSYNTSLIVRLLNAEIPVLWDLGVRRLKSVVSSQFPERRSSVARLSFIVFVTNLACNIFIQGANTYLHVSIQATDLSRRFQQAPQDFAYSRALAPWCYDTGEGFGTIANKNFWGCALEVMEGSGNQSLGFAGLTKKTSWMDVDQNYESYLITYTDATNVTYAIVKSHNTDSSVDWMGRGYAASTSCQFVPPTLCTWTSRLGREAVFQRLWPFNCSSIDEQLVGNLSYYAHLVRLNDFHEYLKEEPPFMSAELGSGTLIWSSESEDAAKTLTAVGANDVIRNPFTFHSQLSALTNDEDKFPTAIEESDLAWILERESYPGARSVKFLFSCSVSVWDVKYTMINNKVEALFPTLSNASVAGAVSMPSGGLSTFAATSVNRVHALVHRDIEHLTPSILKQRYELETSKSMISSMAVHSIAAPVDAVQLRRSEVITKLPALALWFLVIGNTLFVLLAIVTAIYAIASASKEVHQVQLRLSSAGLAAQLFSSDTAGIAAKDDFDLFHTRHAGDEEQLRRTSSLVEVHSTSHGGAEFVVRSRNEKPDNGVTEQRACTEQTAHPSFDDQTLRSLLTRRTL